MRIGARVSGTNLCADVKVDIFSSLKLVLKVNKRNLLFGWVMEGSIIFCQKNILEHSLSFFGAYKKRQ
jgi:hypothetical protein